MGVGLTTCFESELPNADAFRHGTDGKQLAALIPLLDAIAVGRGLAPFSRFIPELDDIDWEGIDEDDIPELWFDPTEGMRLVAVLREAIVLLTAPEGRNHDWPKPVQELKRNWGKMLPGVVENVVYCLDLLAQDLAVAKQAGTRFSLTYA